MAVPRAIGPGGVGKMRVSPDVQQRHAKRDGWSEQGRQVVNS